MKQIKLPAWLYFDENLNKLVKNYYLFTIQWTENLNYPDNK